MESQVIKSLSTDKRVKNRIRFASSKQKGKRATADVYRSYKRRSGSTAAREERIHYSDQNQKRQRLEDEDSVGEGYSFGCDFARELDLAFDRNASEIFAKFHREVWHLVRSLPELLHHSSKIVQVMVKYLLSPRNASGTASFSGDNKSEGGFQSNLATVEILHLFGVLARDLRLEIHAHLHSLIMPRIIDDLLNPPLIKGEKGERFAQLDVEVVEAAFRAIAYILRYDADSILNDKADPKGPFLEQMRPYYGRVFAHKLEVVRRLAAETFAPLVRRVPSESGRKKHLRKILRAFVSSETPGDLSQFHLDAVNGISSFCFEISRGVSGKFHSKGKFVLECILDIFRSTAVPRSRLIFMLVETVILRFLKEMGDEEAPEIFSAVLSSLGSSIESQENSVDGPVSHFRLLTSMLAKDVCSPDDVSKSAILKSLETCCTKKVVEKMRGESGGNWIQLLSKFWFHCEGQNNFDVSLSNMVAATLKLQCQEKSLNFSGSFVIRAVFQCMAQTLSRNTVMVFLAPTLAQLAFEWRDDPSFSSEVFHCLGSLGNRSDESGVWAGDDDIINIQDVEKCVLDSDLQDFFLGSLTSQKHDGDLEKIVISSTALAFLCKTRNREGKMLFERKQEEISLWFLSVAQKLSSTNQYRDGVDHSGLSFSITMDSFFTVLDACDEKTLSKRWMTVQWEKFTSLCEKHLFLFSKSLFCLKCVSRFTTVAKKYSVAAFKDREDEIFELLIPFLRDENHFFRLHALEILCSFPKRPYVVDHSDLDLTGDLDEEPDSQHNLSGKGDKKIVLSGSCNLIDILLSIELTPVSLDKERYLLSLISRVEINARSKCIPISYAEAAASHMIGLYYAKFSPLWKASTKALVELASAYGSYVWVIFEGIFSNLMKSTKDPEVPEAKEPSFFTGAELFKECIKYNNGRLSTSNLFRHQVYQARSAGVVSFHLNTDKILVLGSLWDLLSQIPFFLVKNSVPIVQFFLDFLENEFFVINNDDPDGRELSLCKPKVGDSPPVDKSRCYKIVVFALKAFSSVKGPTQLHRCNLLLRVFRGFLGNQDERISLLAFACVKRFKLDFLLPCADTVEKLFQRKSFRDALLELLKKADEGIISDESRSKLVPLLVRIAYGKMSTQSFVKGSKDSPSARRAAILSFFSSFVKAQGDFFPLVYFSLRSYIPSSDTSKPIEDQSDSDNQLFQDRMMSLSSPDFFRLPTSLHQGVLLMMTEMIQHLGFRISSWIPVFLKVLTTLLDTFGIQGESDRLEKIEEASRIDSRASSIRSLLYRVLATIIDRFSHRIDMLENLEEILRLLEPAFKIMARSSATDEKAPALLLFLKTLSHHSHLHSLLSKGSAFAASVQCLRDKASSSTVDAALSVLENVTSLDDPSIHHNVVLIEANMEEILAALRSRLSLISTSSTWRRELNILCGVSSFLKSDNGYEMGSTVCELISLLVVFLGPSTKLRDEDRLNVVVIMGSLEPLIPDDRLSGLFDSLTGILGPHKGKEGILSRQCQKEMALLFSKISARQPSLRKVSLVLEKLCSVERQKVDEPDYDTILPSLASLSEEDGEFSWMELASGNSDARGPSKVAPVVLTVFSFLYRSDSVASRAALKSLRSLLNLICGKSLLLERNENDVWRRFLESCVVPQMRSGLSCRDSSVRKFFILLFSYLAEFCKDSPHPNLHGDLHVLTRKDDPDLDFFLNLTHVQIHRRAKAFQRFRKHLQDQKEQDRFSAQSLSCFFIPIVLHPIYESEQKIDESLALEAIATLGAISRKLSWSKYSGTLWTLLTQLSRSSGEDRFIIGAVCTILDNFPFELPQDGSACDSDVIWKALERRFIPKLDAILTKEKVDRDGTKTKVLRPTVVLALLKIYQKMPHQVFESRLPHLLMTMCSCLKSRDSDTRDVARSTLSKFATSIDTLYLRDIVRELSLSLTEGYQLHVRLATLHSILLSLQEAGRVPRESSIDPAVPAIMDVVQQDLFGEAQDRRDDTMNQVRYVKEASGSKSQHIFELLACLISFDPSKSNLQSGLSSIHVLVSPLLERIRSPGCRTKEINRAKECLFRVVQGLARNETVTPTEALPFVYATIEPFIATSGKNSEPTENDFGSDSEDDSTRPISISGSSSVQKRSDRARTGEVASWLPSSKNKLHNAKEAKDMKVKNERSLVKVLDGASAPKLTGSSRNGPSLGINEAATVAANCFGLQLLLVIMKKIRPGSQDSASLSLQPFVPLLSRCICVCRDAEIILLSLKVMSNMLKMKDLDLSRVSKILAPRTLELLISTGPGSGGQEDLLQACFKLLTHLLKADHFSGVDSMSTEAMIKRGSSILEEGKFLPLNGDQMQVLISFLKVSLTSSDQHNPAIHLVKALLSRRFASVEFYDLMETLLDLTVRSDRVTLRQQSGNIFISYLLNYPMSESRRNAHFNKIMSNIKYEYADGRLSAIELADSLMQKLPLEVLESNFQLFFLPLTLQLANDDSKKCQTGLSVCVSTLFSRISLESTKTLVDYMERWFSGDKVLKKTSLQLYSILMDSRPDFMYQTKKVSSFLAMIKSVLQDNEREPAYFALICLEKMKSRDFSSEVDLWMLIVDCLILDEPQVVNASSRLLVSYLCAMDPTKDLPDSCFVKQRPGALFQLARNFTFALNTSDDRISDDLVTRTVKVLSWIIQAMHNRSSSGSPHPLNESEEDQHHDGVRWVMRRLSGMTKSGTKRRQAVYKCFAGFSLLGDFVYDHLAIMLEPLHRTEREFSGDPNDLTAMSTAHMENNEEVQLARNVFQLLEEKCSSQDVFLEALAKVQKDARTAKEERKVQEKTLAILDPKLAAEKKLKKHQREKQRVKKRKQDAREGLRPMVKKYRR